VLEFRFNVNQGCNCSEVAAAFSHLFIQHDTPAHVQTTTNYSIFIEKSDSMLVCIASFSLSSMQEKHAPITWQQY